MTSVITTLGITKRGAQHLRDSEISDVLRAELSDVLPRFLAAEDVCDTEAERQEALVGTLLTYAVRVLSTLEDAGLIVFTKE